MSYSLVKIASLIGAHPLSEGDANIDWILTDSRSLCFPEETLFFALKTKRGDGHRYIPDLYARGVRSFVVEQMPENIADYPDAHFLKVFSTLKALQRLAERHREEFDIPVVGVTGSNGKTMVKEWLYHLLSPTKVVCRSPRSYNSQVGVPLSVLLLDERTQLGVFEAGISQPEEMDALRAMIQPTIGILTNIGTAHQENFISMQAKCLEKLVLFKDAGLLIFNADDALIRNCVRRSLFAGRQLEWSETDDSVPLYISKIEKSDTSTTVHYVYRGVAVGDSETEVAEAEQSYVLPFIDDASVRNSIHCLAACLYLGLSPEQIADGMATLEPVAMRLEVKEGRNGCTLINDSYNSDINSLDIALDFMNRRPDRRGRNRALIISDILQSGIPADELYQKVAHAAESRGIEKLIGIGPEISAHAQCFSASRQQTAAPNAGSANITAPLVTYFFPDTESFIASKVFANISNEVVLLKGARQFRFDRLSAEMELRVHETILEVNLGAVVANLNYYRSFMHPETKMVCMVKASAYGAGSLEVAKTLQDHRVDYLAVAVADEGADLRKAGITANIIVMNPEMTAFQTMFEYKLEPEVYNFRLMEALIRAAEKEGITNFPVHIKLDTGMHRLGFDPEHDMPALIDRLHRQNAIVPRSVFSHFVGSDNDGFDAFSAHQFELFDHASLQLQKAFRHRILRHICNSAGIEHFPQYHLDMVRLGLGLYGINSRNNEVIHNVSTLKTTILQIRDVPEGDSVGYSRKQILKRPSRIAAIPIGYADGLNRRLGNGHAYCLVNGQKAYYVGNICMDVAMIDVTDIPCREGDRVEIFGDALPITTLSDILGTIPYEVLTGVSTRVKRIYFQE
jgi:alanine racemase